MTAEPGAELSAEPNAEPNAEPGAEPNAVVPRADALEGAELGTGNGDSGARPRWVQPLLVVLTGAVAVAAARIMINSKESVVATPPPVVEPLVEVIDVHLEPVRLQVDTLGELRPRREGTLTPEIAGRVIDVADALVQGGRVKAGALLVQLDAAPLRVGLKQAEAGLAQALARQLQVQAEAERSVNEWRQAGRTGEPPPLVAKLPALAEAAATVEAAEAAKEESLLDVKRAQLRAPFDGLVRTVEVSVGSYVQGGQRLATLYQSDPMEVRFALTERELSRLDRSALLGASGIQASVSFSCQFAGATSEYTGEIVRLEGEVDPASRMVQVVAEVHQSPSSKTAAAPLLSGVIVDAAIEGRLIPRAARIPTTALFEPGLCLVLGKEGRLERRRVQVALVDGSEAVIESGLLSGERIVISPLDVAVDGMAVRVHKNAGASEIPGAAPRPLKENVAVPGEATEREVGR